MMDDISANDKEFLIQALMESVSAKERSRQVGSAAPIAKNEQVYNNIIAHLTSPTSHQSAAAQRQTHNTALNLENVSQCNNNFRDDDNDREQVTNAELL